MRAEVFQTIFLCHIVALLMLFIVINQILLNLFKNGGCSKMEV